MKPPADVVLMPSLRKTGAWMAGLGFMTLWCFGAIFQSAIADPSDVLPAVGCTAMFGVGFAVAYWQHMKVIEQRRAWRERRVQEWWNRELPDPDAPITPPPPEKQREKRRVPKSVATAAWVFVIVALATTIPWGAVAVGAAYAIGAFYGIGYGLANPYRRYRPSRRRK